MKLRINFGFSECIKIEIVLVSLIVLFTVLKRNSAISICFALSFVILIVYAIKRAAIKKFEVQPLLLIAVAVINVLVNGLISSNANLGFDYFKKVIMFCAFVLMLYFSEEDLVFGKAIKILKSIPVACAFLLVVSYFLLGNTIRYAGGITLGFSNPNFTGMWLLHLAIYTLLFIIDGEKHLLTRIFSGILFFSVVWLIFQTKARSCLIGIASFCFLCLIGKVFGNYIAKNTVFIVVIVISPILLVILYHYILNASWFLKLFSAFVSEGKSLDSRLAVWDPAIKILKSNVILGNYSGISNGTGMSQLHNTHLDVICSYGIVPFLFFLSLLNSVCKRVSNQSMEYSNYCALCGFISVIIMGSFEAAVVAGAMGLNILTAGLIILANAKEEQL